MGGRRQHAGFTLVELVMVILVVGALAVVALPRLLDLGAWRLQAYGDELASEMAAMQRLALQQRRPIVATINTTGVVFTYASGGTLRSLACPAAASPCLAESGPRSITFNSGNSGRAVSSSGAALPITVAHGGSSRGFVIEHETGLFRPAP